MPSSVEEGFDDGRCLEDGFFFRLLLLLLLFLPVVSDRFAASVVDSTDDFDRRPLDVDDLEDLLVLLVFLVVLVLVVDLVV